MSIEKELQRLIKLDQKNIKDFCAKKIDRKEYLDLATNLSSDFLSTLKQFGFPYKNTVSDKTYLSGVTLALHLDLPNLKKLYTNHIRKSTSEQVLPEHKIIFIDKIRVLSGKTQLYGSQYINEGNKIKLLPIKDQNNVDKRRADIGVGPLAKYLGRVRRSL